MSHPIDRAAEVMQDAWKERGKDRLMDSTQTMIDVLTRALDAAGLLVTPAHDAAVAAKALREAADRLPAFHDRDVPEWAITSAFKWLRERADQTEASHE